MLYLYSWRGKQLCFFSSLFITMSKRYTKKVAKESGFLALAETLFVRFFATIIIMAVTIIISEWNDPHTCYQPIQWMRD